MKLSPNLGFSHAGYTGATTPLSNNILALPDKDGREGNSSYTSRSDPLRKFPVKADLFVQKLIGLCQQPAPSFWTLFC